ncbi:uncharacterized protein FOMMEDRAFT_138407 [Fomitiporia mediterranea MF3/22]|uniref:uncharacterized protein n=1 Tax=Fomitiporia mediterranea (strain MF3/22) TaxID=694068 RepID=UPI00044082E0|nr:uncharacterized protein FOMMEDRAFT_138407 [Fomitiporia mediterranea MF3/22]EJD06438.1 hypothetical protein FOMMEDRAFT_138407 [Fomitiporia mediterranea MF3/22]
MISFAVLVLAIVNIAHAQVSTATIADVGFPVNYQGGIVIGTGAEGTTFILSGTDLIDRPYTMTVAQDATHISMGSAWDAVVAMPPYNLPPYEIRCGLSQSVAICTVNIEQFSTHYTERMSATRVLVSPGPTASSSTRTGLPGRMLIFGIPAFLALLSLWTPQLTAVIL